jgi:predicted methyltransferase
MKSFVLTLITTVLLALGVATPLSADDAAIASAIANENRTDADRKRDERSKPEIILGLLDLQSGQAVVDLFAGGGYYSELLAGVVGPEGTVILQNNYGFAKWVEKYLQERYIDSEVPAITVLRSEVPDLKLDPESLDAALMIMSYHDLYYYNPDVGFERADVPDFFAQVHAALKPGGKLLIVDHAAVEGTGTGDTQTIHRIDEAYARKDIESNGFKFVASSDALRNSDDDRTKLVFDKTIRGKTDRFILLFEKS